MTDLLQWPPSIEAIGLAVALLVAVVIVIALLTRKRKPGALELPPLPKPGAKISELPKVHLPPSEREAARKAEAETLHREAEALKAQRQALQEQARQAEARDREALQAEAKALKEQEEEKKRAEYKAKKEAETEARERQKREVEETAAQKAALEQQAREQEAAALKLAQEEEAKRVEAQSGQTLAQGLSKTRSQGFMAKLNTFFGAPKVVDESVLGELEEILFTADIGVKTAASLVDVARAKAKRNELASADKIKAVIQGEIARIVELARPPTLTGGGPPHVVMVVGVNGSGKTTTIGKLAAKLTAEGKKVVLAAGDTFRAAAAEQLDVWAVRANAELIQGKENADPSSVIFDAIARAKLINADVVIADTAGRLHTQAPLMEELKKVKRVMGKALPGAPHEVLLVLDATNGQNAIHQAKQFHDAVGVTAIALTKLDGTAKGGVIIGICDELKIPVAWVGVGEKVADLRAFSPNEFVSALFQ